VPRPGPTSHRVNHDQLRSVGQKRVAARRGWPRIDRSLKAGARTDAGREATGEGTPPGGPWSPWLANRWRDGLDKERERRGHRFGRDADDGTIDVKRLRAGPRGLARVTRVLERRLQWAGKAANSAGDRPWRRPNRRRVRDKALQAGQEEGRRRTCRTRGESLGRVGGDLRRDREGWSTSVGVAEAPSSVKARDSGLRRRWRGSRWQPWARRRDRPRRRRGVSRDLAWNTVKSAHGPWRLSRRPALALPGSSCDGLGWPRLPRGSQR
jgi:RNA-directed DNA polymerase